MATDPYATIAKTVAPCALTKSAIERKRQDLTLELRWKMNGEGASDFDNGVIRPLHLIINDGDIPDKRQWMWMSLWMWIRMWVWMWVWMWMWTWM